MRNHKIKTAKELKPLISAFKKRAKTVAFTNGCFDILHYGHIKYLEQAKNLSDILIVGVNSDSSVKRSKGPKRPFYALRQRMGVLAALSSVDYVIAFKEDTPLKIIEYLKPDMLVKGADYRIKDIVGSKLVRSYGGCVKRIRYIKGFSVSSLIKKIAKRYGR